MSDTDTEESFRVVRNDEDQHALWPALLPLPAGWTDIGFGGTRQDCLAHVRLVWTDITPKSARVPRMA